MRWWIRGFGAAMPDSMSVGQSPAAQLWGKFWRQPSARVAFWVVVACFMVALYAPLIISDVALLWHDADGWSLPWLSSLFNRTLYPEYYDVLFNVCLCCCRHYLLWDGCCADT